MRTYSLLAAFAVAIILTPVVAHSQIHATAKTARQPTVSLDSTCTEGAPISARFVVIADTTFAPADTSARMTFAKSDVAKNSGTDTAFIWSAPRWFGTTWRVRLSDDAIIDVAERTLRFHRIAIDTRSPRYQRILAVPKVPCVYQAAVEFIEPAGPRRAFTHADAVAASIEPSYATIPFLTVGLPREVHTDRETGRTQSLPLLFEAVVAPAFMFTGLQVPAAISITPKLVIRQFNHGSQPVDAPSFMPRVTFYYWGPPVPSRPNDYHYLWGMFSHHSNGQEGSPLDSATGQRNYYTGNFSTNYVEVGWNESRLDANGALQSTSVAFDYYIAALTDTAQRLQGNYRIRLVSNVLRELPIKLNVFKGTADVTWIMGPLEPALHGGWRHLNFGYTYSVSVPHAAWFDFFANFYTGQDYYNMRYDRRITLFRVGGSLNTLTFRL